MSIDELKLECLRLAVQAYPKEDATVIVAAAHAFLTVFLPDEEEERAILFANSKVIAQKTGEEWLPDDGE